MKYVYLGNNRLAYRVLSWLVEQGNPPVGLVVHPAPRARYRDEMVEATNLKPEHVLEGPELGTAEGIEWLVGHQPEWLVSVHFGYILKLDVLAVPRRGAVNLHPGLLPFNRGAYPNVWAIVDRTPAGVTLHLMDAGVDTGDIIAQREMPVEPTDTGATLYARLEDAALGLFQETWPSLVTGSFWRASQPGGGTFHRVSDVERIDRIDPNQQMRAGDLIDIIRARTFPPHKGAYLDLPDRRIYLRLELVEEQK